MGREHVGKSAETDKRGGGQLCRESHRARRQQFRGVDSTAQRDGGCGWNRWVREWHRMESTAALKMAKGAEGSVERTSEVQDAWCRASQHRVLRVVQCVVCSGIEWHRAWRVAVQRVTRHRGLQCSLWNREWKH